MARVLKNHDVESLYPSTIEQYGYSSRNQANADDYIVILHTRKKAKHGLLEDSFLKQFNVTNSDLSTGLKLPLNAYSGCLRAVFNKLYDPLQGFSICTTGQCFIMQLIHDLTKIPTLEMVSANTDAVMYTIEEEYYPQAKEILNKWQDKTRFKLEDDDIQKIIMRDVNNYAEIIKTGDNEYEVHYKGGELTRGKHKFTWNKNKQIFEYQFKDSLKNNSLSICSEALLKKLLFDIPIENTINNCNDVFRFQMITHLGHTYEKCVQESEDGDILLQRNNRIYAGKQKSGLIYKVKADGKRDKVASCPDNPIVDNKNEITIDLINKQWYIKYAMQKLNDFKGVKRLEDYKKEELLDYCKEKNIDVKKTMKKDEILKIIEDMEKSKIKDEMVEDKKEEVKIVKEKKENKEMNLLEKINELRKIIRNTTFLMDKELPNNLGGGEYASIGQYYDAIQNGCIKVGLDFSWDVTDIISFEKGLFKPQGKPEQHVWTVRCLATLVDIKTGDKKEYVSIASGSDICDKGVSGASTLAFRNWFDKNFSPCSNDDENVPSENEEKSVVPKTPTYIPAERKEELTKTVVETKQQEESDDDDIKSIVNTINKIRDLGVVDGKNYASYGEQVLKDLISGKLSSAEILSIKLQVENKYDKLIPFAEV